MQILVEKCVVDIETCEKRMKRMKLSQSKTIQLIVLILIFFSCISSIVLLRNAPSSREVTLTSLWKRYTGDYDFTVIVLTMNRVNSLKRLLSSLENAKYGSDVIKLSIKIDKSDDNTDVISFARKFAFSHGPVDVDIAQVNKGLRDAWLQAVSPQERSKVVIFEDDVEVSREWYMWLTAAWLAYEHRTDVAGIALCRPTIIAKYPMRFGEILNNHEPFLYSLVGSIGFSPHPLQWSSFLNWTLNSVDIETFDFSVPNIIFTNWWREGNRRDIWTLLFIYYCVMNDLYTIHISLPGHKTLVSNMRENGVHFQSTKGRDFMLASSEDVQNISFPTVLKKYGFDGKEMLQNATSNSTLF